MRKRIEWLDFAKGITIFFVVFGHSLSTMYDTKNVNPLFFVTLESIIFTFIMPCFFAISGYLYKPINSFHNYKLLLYKKIINLGIPYILFSIIYVILQNFGGNNINHPVKYQNLSKIFSTPIAYLWYIYALFFIFIIVGLLNLIHINKYFQLIIYFWCMIISIKINISFTGLNYILNNILYFYIGYLISDNINKKVLNKIILSKKVTILLTITFVLLLIIQSSFIVGTANDDTNFENIITKIISILLLFNISNVFPNNKLYKYFTKYGKYTLIIYLFHAPIMSAFRVIVFKIIFIDDITSILISISLIIIVWLFSIFICYLSKKYPFVYYIFYPYKFIDKLKIR